MRKRKHLEVMTIIAVLLSLCMVYIWNCNKKQDFHTDEYFTYEIANSTRIDMSLPYETWFDSDYIFDEMIVDENERFVFHKVVEKEKGDLHPFLYPAIIHGICSFFPGQFNMWFGLAYNIICALLTCVVVYAIMRYLTNSFMIAIACMITFGAAAGVIKQVTFTRMYVMVMLLVTVTLYLHCRYWNSPESRVFYIGVCLVSAIGALTHYYYLVFLLPCFALYFIKLLKRKEYGFARKYFFTECVAAALALTLFPHMIHQMIRMVIENSGSPDVEVEAMSYIEKLRRFFDIMYKDLFGTVLIPTIVLIVVFVLLIRVCALRKCKGTFAISFGIIALVVLPASMYFLLAVKTSPYITDRYIAPLYPILMIAVFYMGYLLAKSVCNLNNKYLVVILMAFSFLFINASHMNNKNGYLYEDRRDIIQMDEFRMGRDLVYLIPEYTEWIVPSSAQELKDYERIMLLQYPNIYNAKTIDMLPSNLPFNVYVATWNTDKEEQKVYLDTILEHVRAKNPSVVSEKLWDTWYATAYQITE